MTAQDYIDYITCSLKVARDKAKKEKLSEYEAGFHMGQIAALQSCGHSHAVHEAAVNAATEIYQLFKSSGK